MRAELFDRQKRGHEVLELNKLRGSLRVSRRGATVTSWKVRGVDVLFPEDDTHLVGGEPKRRGGIPICFPNFGPTPKGTRLNQHGFLRDAAMDVYVNGPVLALEETADTLDVYPYQFQVAVECVFVSESGFRHRMQVTNTERRVLLPIGPALHPYFRTPEGTAKVIWADGEMVVDKPAIDAVQVHTNGNVVRIEIPGIGQVWIDSLDYNINGSGLDFVVWRDSAEYICVEPITSTPGKMAKVLTPGESRMLTVEFLLVAPRRS